MEKEFKKKSLKAWDYTWERIKKISVFEQISMLDVLEKYIPHVDYFSDKTRKQE